MQGMTPERISQRKTSLAIWLRDGLIKLGPTFIKIGQQFSTRVDVLSPEFIRELEQLQDSVPPFESQDAVNIVERDLKGKVESIFEEFDREPIAAASLGQVGCFDSLELFGLRILIRKLASFNAGFAAKPSVCPNRSRPLLLLVS